MKQVSSRDEINYWSSLWSYHSSFYLNIQTTQTLPPDRAPVILIRKDILPESLFSKKQSQVFSYKGSHYVNLASRFIKCNKEIFFKFIYYFIGCRCSVKVKWRSFWLSPLWTLHNRYITAIQEKGNLHQRCEWLRPLLVSTWNASRNTREIDFRAQIHINNSHLFTVRKSGWLEASSVTFTCK